MFNGCCGFVRKVELPRLGYEGRIMRTYEVPFEFAERSRPVEEVTSDIQLPDKEGVHRDQ